MDDVLAVILGGGVGSRMFPLTRDRTKPAVPIAGKYRLIDIPMSNCMHAGINKVAILTQFNSVSLHRHVQRTYRRDIFSPGWVQILAAEQTYRSDEWYHGTADALRKQTVELKSAGSKYTLILAGDHLYLMDYSEFVQEHIASGAKLSVAVQPVGREDASGLGILKLNNQNRIVEFVEKPQTDEVLANFVSGNNPQRPYMASMGIYMFDTEYLFEVLDNTEGTDFGKHILPAIMQDNHIHGYVFDGYWEDIGTIRRFYEVNLDMASPLPKFNLYDQRRPIYTRPRFLPGSKVERGSVYNVLMADGCRIQDASIHSSVIGLRSIILHGVTIQRTVMMGADFYESEAQRAENLRVGRPNVGIGPGSVIEGAIIDKNARIGRKVIIRNLPDRPDEDHDNWYSREGIVIVPKNGIIYDDTII